MNNSERAYEWFICTLRLVTFIHCFVRATTCTSAYSTFTDTYAESVVRRSPCGVFFGDFCVDQFVTARHVQENAHSAHCSESSLIRFVAARKENEFFTPRQVIVDRTHWGTETRVLFAMQQ